MISILDKQRIVAGPGFNRWLVPPAALAIHLSIGMAYGFSVFVLPLSRAVGITAPIGFPDDASMLDRLFSTSHDWSVSMLGWMYTLFFVFLGGSAAVFGPWVEKVGPRMAGMTAACCWGGGLVLAALGVFLHQIWLLWLGAGVVGGIGLGLGYISPVSTLIKWFPDRRGMATGLAIMGFGGGAMVGAPLGAALMQFFASETDVGAWQTLLVLGAVYFVAMALGAFGYRLPPPGWSPTSGTARSNDSAVTAPSGRFVPVSNAHRTPQFWLAWGVLCLNVSAGIGILGMASPMIQEVFGGRLIGIDAPLDRLAQSEKDRVAAIGAGFAGLLSLFNIVGRIAWASLSDWIGRKATYAIFLLLGAVLYACLPWTGRTGNVALFVAIFCVILTMYGGGFAAIPAYLADLFGAQHISAIHGRLLTAWSVAGILGPVVVNYLRDTQRARGVPASEAYDATMLVLACMLIVGFVCNLLIRAVHETHFETVEPQTSPAQYVDSMSADVSRAPVESSSHALLVLAWSAVGIPLLWGMIIAIRTASAFLD